MAEVELWARDRLQRSTADVTVATSLVCIRRSDQAPDWTPRELCGHSPGPSDLDPPEGLDPREGAGELEGWAVAAYACRIPPQFAQLSSWELETCRCDPEQELFLNLDEEVPRSLERRMPFRGGRRW